jgi:hypothetical protein
MQALTNQDVFMYALYRLQGAGHFVDVEDIYVECWRLSPSRFGWRKLPYPNYKVAAKALQHIEAHWPTFLIKTPNSLERQLSSEGLMWVRSRLSMFGALESGETKAPKQRRLSHRLIAEVRRSPLIEMSQSGQDTGVSRLAISELLHCSPDSPRSIWKQRLETLRAAAIDNEAHDVQQFLEFLTRKHPEWFGMEG